MSSASRYDRRAYFCFCRTAMDPDQLHMYARDRLEAEEAQRLDAVLLEELRGDYTSDPEEFDAYTKRLLRSQFGHSHFDAVAGLADYEDYDRFNREAYPLQDEWELMLSQRHALYHRLLVLTEELGCKELRSEWHLMQKLDRRIGHAMPKLSAFVLESCQQYGSESDPTWRLPRNFDPNNPFPNTRTLRV